MKHLSWLKHRVQSIIFLHSEQMIWTWTFCLWLKWNNRDYLSLPLEIWKQKTRCTKSFLYVSMRHHMVVSERHWILRVMTANFLKPAREFENRSWRKEGRGCLGRISSKFWRWVCSLDLYSVKVVFRNENGTFSSDLERLKEFRELQAMFKKERIPRKL